MPLRVFAVATETVAQDVRQAAAFNADDLVYLLQAGGAVGD